MTKVNLDGMSHVEMIGVIEEIVKRIKTESFSEGYEAGRIRGASDISDLLRERTKETPQQAREILDGAKTVIERARKTAQHVRDRIVEQAKKDIEALKEFTGTLTKRRGYNYQAIICDADFIVNREKRTVVCLIKWQIGGRIVSKGIAKCAPGDCFNVHIGKAIALRRALGLEVPAEYLNAPQPTEVRVGDVIEREGIFEETSGVRTVVEIIEEGRRTLYRTKEARGTTESKNVVRIIDDSRCREGEGVSE